MKYNASGERMFAIWAGPGEPPETAYHSESEWNALLDEVNQAMAGRGVTAKALHDVVAKRNPAYAGFAADPAIAGKSISDLDVALMFARLNGTTA